MTLTAAQERRAAFPILFLLLFILLLPYQFRLMFPLTEGEAVQFRDRISG